MIEQLKEKITIKGGDPSTKKWIMSRDSKLMDRISGGRYKDSFCLIIVERIKDDDVASDLIYVYVPYGEGHFTVFNGYREAWYYILGSEEMYARCYNDSKKVKFFDRMKYLLFG